MISLPQEAIDARFLEVQRAVELRWNEVIQKWSFPKYQLRQDEAPRIQEFSHFDKIRFYLHIDTQKFPYQAKPEFKLAQDIFIHHLYRQPNCITFDHSKADDSYNCTCVSVGRKRFFALDGPTAETLKYFYRLLANWDVKTLICLTDQEENGIPKCFPYWAEKTLEEESVFHLPIEGSYQSSIDLWEKKKILFHHLPEWKDGCAIDVKTLIDAVNKVRKQNAANDIIAVHCSGGVGRTGTFIAAFYLLEEIDRQTNEGTGPADVELSIAELFLKLNLHRPLMVAEEAQYLVLFKMVDYYLEELLSKKLKV